MEMLAEKAAKKLEKKGKNDPDGKTDHEEEK
jgi:hypothetical protein